MENLQNICVEETMTISNGIKRLDQSGEKIILVTKDGILSGVITDGDVRRWILKNGSFEETVDKLMHRNPKVVSEEEKEQAKQIMVEYRLEAVPVVDQYDRPVDVIFWRDLIGVEKKEYKMVDVPVVIMAGGKGTRLYPYTNVLPKPLIPIGDTTILERIINSFQKNGCDNFWLTLNYKKGLIKAYFDEKDKAYRLHYVEEDDFYGTCGSLSLLKDVLEGDFFVSNCDVLLDIDYAKLLDFHRINQNKITAVTSLKHIRIPYGIFDLKEGGAINKIVEKPEYSYNVNTGIYVINSSVLQDIPRGEVYQMTDLMEKLLKENRRVGAYPITDKCWKDMGEIGEMQKMISDLHSS